MSESKKSEDFGKAIKILGEIVGYVSTILPYILTILGKGSIPYPTLASTLTLIISVIILWRWRWPVITQKKLNSSRTEGKRQKQETKSGAIKLRDLFRKSTNHLYSMPLLRRQMELTLLSLFALGALGLGSMNFQSVQEEITGFHCLSDVRDFRVVITDFSTDKNFEDDLAGIMYLQSGDRFQICRYHKQVHLPDLAQQYGENNKANLVVWGSDSNGLVNISLTAIDWKMLNQRHGGLSVGQSQEQVAFLAEIISAEILYNQGETVAAQNSLYDALDKGETQSWVESAPSLLAEGYFELGLLYDPNFVSTSDSDAKRATEEYSNAIKIINEWNLDLEGAYLNRAQLYSNDGNDEKAAEDYTVLINKGGEDVSNLYFLRGQSYYYAGKCSATISDLGKVRNDPALEADFLPYLIHYLGASYLLCGDLEAAEQTYQTMPALTRDSAEDFIAELNELVDNSEDLAEKEVIPRIIDHIRQLQTQ